MTARRRVPEFDFGRVRRELDIREDFPADALTEAEAAAQTPAPQPAQPGDLDIPFVTLDPPGSKDLDQALHIERAGEGYLVRYAIADVASFVAPGGALDAETWRRDQTLYCPDIRIPLHPQTLSEGAASLLPDQIRPAALWEIQLDATGTVTSHSVRRTAVRSVAQLDYPSVQQSFTDNTAHESLALLAEVGPKRIELAIARNSINLNLPEQVVEEGPDGGWILAYREQLPCELWNAEISLLTGMVAAQMMVEAGVGILRTLPTPADSALKELRKTARSLGIDWPDGATISRIMNGLDRSNPRHVAFIEQTPSLLRGADYLGFTSGHPDAPHSGIGALYAHVTAPLRRLVDRYAAETCLAIAAGEPIPQWVTDALPKLPETMKETGQVERNLESIVVDTVEALLLADRVGEQFSADVIGHSKDGVTVVLQEPAVRARAKGSAELGDAVQVTVVAADPAHHKLDLVLV